LHGSAFVVGTHGKGQPTAIEPGLRRKLAYRHVGICGMLGVAAICGGCNASIHPYRLEMMPPPAIYTTGAISSPDERHRELRDGVVSLPYATPREPAGADNDEPFYRNARGSVLRLGVAVVSAAVDDKTRHGAQHEAPEQNASPMLLEVTGAEELGVLAATHAPFAAADFDPSAAESGQRTFAAAIDSTLLDGPGRDVYIYVHGYKVLFENAVAVSTELWHYLDYEGAFIAFAWPATPSRTAYFGDLETAEMAAIVLRRFLTYLSTETHARRIHVVGYSAGTRVVTTALAGLALSQPAGPSPECFTCNRIGQVVLIGSDMDRGLMGLQLSDGALNLVDGFTVYVSSKDKALNISRRLHGRDRAGEAFTPGQPPPAAKAWLDAHPKLSVIDVTDAAESTNENGHRYFRKSPWVSSDMLMMLRFGLGPEARGLVRSADSAMWRFPPDYIERLSAAVAATAAGRPAPSTTTRGLLGAASGLCHGSP
jgi:esterase/lipase superfamily enzyme